MPVPRFFWSNSCLRLVPNAPVARPASGLAELSVLYEGTFLAVLYDDAPFTCGFTWTWDRLLGFSFLHIPYRLLPLESLTSPRRRLVVPEHCARGGVQ